MSSCAFAEDNVHAERGDNGFPRRSAPRSTRHLPSSATVNDRLQTCATAPQRAKLTAVRRVRYLDLLLFELGQVGSLLLVALQLPLMKGFLVVLVLLLALLAALRLNYT